MGWQWLSGLPSKLDITDGRHEAHDGVRGIPLEPANTEIRSIRKLMVVVLKELAQGDEVQGKTILTLIVVVEVLVAIAMSPVQLRHGWVPLKEMDGQE